jgi:histidinol dehydrogenase
MAFSARRDRAEIAKVSAEDRAALELAADRIRAYHERQIAAGCRKLDRCMRGHLGWRWTPVSAAGLYVPGGRPPIRPPS